MRAHQLLVSLNPDDETQILRDTRADDFLTMGIFLHGMGIIPDRNLARYTLLSDDGREFTIDLHSATPVENSNLELTFPFKELPLFRQRPDDSFWFTYLPDSRTVYCSFRGYKDLGNHAKGLFDLIKDRKSVV